MMEGKSSETSHTVTLCLCRSGPEMNWRLSYTTSVIYDSDYSVSEINESFTFRSVKIQNFI